MNFSTITPPTIHPPTGSLRIPDTEDEVLFGEDRFYGVRFLTPTGSLWDHLASAMAECREARIPYRDENGSPAILQVRV